MSATLYSLGEHLRTSLQGGSTFAIVAAFAFGVFVGFTPCVYPILPITVAYIGSIARGSKLNGFLYSLVYVLGMAIVYSTIGVITALAGGQIGVIWNNGWVLLALANLFILLALWQLKVIQIPLPQIIRGAGPRRSGALGALLVGGASGLVVGPCTLPGLAGMVTLIGAHGGSAGSLIFGAAAMFAYSLGLGSLAVICGTFSGILTNLPRSGAWLNAIEKTFAILLILVAECFLIYLGQNAKFPLLSSLFGGQ
jgi:cytochrome c-type biogenesis protein